MFRAARALPALMLASLFLAACGKSATAPATEETTPPPQLDLALNTDDDADSIKLLSDDKNDGSQLRVCLSVSTQSGWWKGVGINQTSPTVEGALSDGMQCADTRPGLISFTFWKAKGLGVHTQVGTRVVDLSQYGGYRVSLIWLTD